MTSPAQTRSPLFCKVPDCTAIPYVFALGFCRGHWWNWVKTGDPQRRKHSYPKRIESEHGTNSRYCNHRCRCEPCRQAHSRYMAEWRARRTA